jgi:hypothetical protein
MGENADPTKARAKLGNAASGSLGYNDDSVRKIMRTHLLPLGFATCGYILANLL